MARTVVSPPVAFDAPPADFRGSTAKEAAEAGRWITVGEGADAHHLFLPAGGFAALRREKLGPGETHHIVSGGKAFGDNSAPKVGQTFFHAGSKQYLTTVRTDSHSIGPAERTGYGLQQGHAVAHHAYARPATEDEAAPHKDAEAAKAKLVGADVLRENLKQQFRKTGQAIDADERVDDPQPGKSYQIHVGSALHLDGKSADFIPHTRQKKRDNDAFYVTPTRTALLDATNGHKKYVLPTTPELIGHIAHIENIRAEGEHDLATAYGRKDETERRVRQGLARHSADSPVTFAAPAVTFAAPASFKDYPYGPEEGHWVTIDGEHVLIRGGRPGEHEHAKPARERGYEGNAEGLIHEDAVGERHKFLDAMAPHEARLAEHEQKIEANKHEATIAAHRMRDTESGTPEHRDAAETANALWKQGYALQTEKQSMMQEQQATLHHLLHAPTPAQVIPYSTNKTVPTKVKESVAAFNQLVDAKVESGHAHMELKRGRAHYTPQTHVATMQSMDGVKVGVHELGHWLEHKNGEINDRAIRFLAYRTKGETSKRLKALTQNPGYTALEVAKPDKFMHPYMGKIYGVQATARGGHQATEIHSMGLENLTTVHSAVAFAKADPEMFDFITTSRRGMYQP